MLISSGYVLLGEPGDAAALPRRQAEESNMGIKDIIQDKTGIYKLGFDPASLAGLLLPLLFVVIVGGGLTILVLMR
jgi:hypothetical protein